MSDSAYRISRRKMTIFAAGYASTGRQIASTGVSLTGVGAKVKD